MLSLYSEVRMNSLIKHPNMPMTSSDAPLLCLIDARIHFYHLKPYLNAAEPPDKPRGLETTSTTSRTATLVWAHPYSGNSPVIKYIIEYKTESGSVCSKFITNTILQETKLAILFFQEHFVSDFVQFRLISRPIYHFWAMSPQFRINVSHQVSVSRC